LAGVERAAAGPEGELTELRVLLVEDSEDDAELIRIALESGGYSPVLHRIETPEALTSSLLASAWDVIISDHNLPRFSAPAALAVVKNHNPKTPFVIVSGQIGEETAVAAMKAGADDYVMKANLGRLAPAVERALRETAERARRAQLEEELRQAQKMEAVGRMAGGIAHDFKNILAAVNGYAELLVVRLGDDPRGDYARQITRAAARGTAMIQQLLAFSRRQELKPQLLPLNGVVDESETMLRQLLGRNVRLVLELAPDAGEVMADPVQLQQVLLNLGVNARDAMDGQGTLTIATGRRDGRGLISVRDTGRGMDAETQARIFEPFFTTKGNQGTGLGLSTVYGIVTQSGGKVEVESAPGQGAQFTILLP
jgi:two-component system cell cycle sensor histidine kinase/response regulator CckA